MSSTATRPKSTFEEFGGRIQYLRRLADKNDKAWSAFNPSIAHSPERGYAVAIRSSNYVILEHGELSVTKAGPIRNRVWFAELDDELKLQNLRQVDFSESGHETSRGAEDPKLMWRGGRWMFTAVAMERNIPRARYCECYMDDDATKVTDIVMYDGIDTNRPEKNWMTCANKPAKFDYIYDGTGIVKDGRVVHWLNNASELSGLRGNTHLLEQADGTYLGVMHRMHGRASKMYSPTRFATVDAYHKNYFHYLVRFDADGRAIEVSDKFQFMGDGIEFASGIVERGDEFVISFGRDDASSHLAIIKARDLLKKLQKIKRQ